MFVDLLVVMFQIPRDIFFAFYPDNTIYFLLQALLADSNKISFTYSSKTANQKFLFLKIFSFLTGKILVWQCFESNIVACRILSVFLFIQHSDLSNNKYNK